MLHLWTMCDVETELSTSFKVTKENYSERQAICDFLKKIDQKQKNKIKYLLLDRGYDSMKMIQTLKGMKIHLIVDIRNFYGEKVKGQTESGLQV